jgi:transposase
MAKLGVGRYFTDHWVAKAKEQRPNVDDKHRSGRPRALNRTLHKAVKRMATGRTTAVKIASRLAQKGKAQVSPSTVLRAIKSGRAGLVWRPVTMARSLREPNKIQRLQFCKSTNMTADVPWIFVDGKQLSLYSGKTSGLTHAWQHADATVHKGDGKLVAVYFFYAAVGLGFKSRLIFVPPSCVDKDTPKSAETFKSEHFVGAMEQLARDLERAGYEGRPYLIIRDRAKQHVSKATVKALAPLKLPILESFPAQSWDINCIEHVWAQLAAAVRQRRPRSARGFKEIIQKEWAAIKQSTIDALVAGVPHRLEKIAELGGSWIGDYKD